MENNYVSYHKLEETAKKTAIETYHLANLSYFQEDKLNILIDEVKDKGGDVRLLYNVSSIDDYGRFITFQEVSFSIIKDSDVFAEIEKEAMRVGRIDDLNELLHFEEDYITIYKEREPNYANVFSFEDIAFNTLLSMVNEIGRKYIDIHMESFNLFNSEEHTLELIDLEGVQFSIDGMNYIMRD